MMIWFVYLPWNGKVSNVMKEFKDLSCFPQVVAALEGFHIRTKVPADNTED